MKAAGRAGIQGHLTIAFPINSPTDAKVLPDKLPPLMPEMYRAEDAMGTVHSSRFVVLSDKTLLLLADYDGELDKLLAEFATRCGRVFDAIFKHVESAPPTPVARNVGAFVAWATRRNLAPMAIYTAYPNATVQDIKSRATAAGVTGTREHLPFLVILPLKGRIARITLKGVFKVAGPILVKGADTIGTLHLAHFVVLEDNKLGFFTVYDAPFDKYIQDFGDKLGPVFDLLFKFVIDPPSTPSAKNVGELTRWVASHDLPPIGMYKSCPGLSVQDVNALLADS